MKKLTQERIAVWSQEGDQIRDLEHEMSELAFRIVGLSLFGADLKDVIAQIGDKFKICLSYATLRLMFPFKVPYHFPLPGAWKEKRARASLEKIIQAQIESRRRDPDLQQKNDILSRLLMATGAQSEYGMDDREVYDQVVTFFFAGHDTTSSSLMWTLYLLSKHPEIQEKVRGEIQSLISEDPPLDVFAKAQELNRVIQESLRLYPPAPSFSRDSIEADTICGYPIAAGSTVSFSAYALHHDAEIWESPEVFDPGRFSPERSVGRHPSSFIPFSEGPRGCIGQAFAMLELQVILSGLLRNFRFSLVKGNEPEMFPAIILRTKRGMKLQVSRLT